ncbi:MAG: hypothetical protein SF028_09125 [Candidatus Sumerlaeia bacterium]|nr:hypothetical protein [Candidatus Sumerlaeia bacterium]
MATGQLSGILRSISGTIGNFNFRTTKNGIVIADRPAKRTSPPTAEQLFAQSYFSTASKQWKALSKTQREAWDKYANDFFPFDEDGDGAGPSGQVVYLKAAFYQQAAGLPLPANAPTAAPPGAPTALTIQTAPDDTTVIVRASHAVAPVTGHRLLVEITPPILSAARQAQPSDFRAVKGLNAASLPALAASATNYTFADIRFQIPDTTRFGCRATIINPQGIPGRAFQATLVQAVTAGPISPVEER